MLSEKLKNFTQAGMLYRGRFVERLPDLKQAIDAAEGEERELLEFLVATLPVTDLGDYSPEILVDSVAHGIKLRREFDWCEALPEHIFLTYVLCPRVNNEQLSDCRELFYQQLRPRVAGMNTEQAILEVNRWCAEKVTYRSTDVRTASALSIYGCGYGRCGEESVFAVNALRSVGIPARQVYAPWWSHCDDNHAWVEAYDGEKWRYLGACEPEPQLDMGWFTCAASRAMICHAKAFVGDAEGWRELFPGVSRLDLDRREGVAYESVTARYGKVRPFTITVTDAAGPKPGALVGLYVLNEGKLRKIAARTTDEAGRVELNLGLGSLWGAAQSGGARGEALVNTVESDRLELCMNSGVLPENVDFFAPAGGDIKLVDFTEAEKVSRRRTLERARVLRDSREPIVNKLDEKFDSIVGCLTEKDMAGELNQRALQESLKVKNPGGLSEEVFKKWLLSPRIGNEPLEPWREELGELAKTLQGAPEIWRWIESNVDKIESFTDLPQTPAGALRLRAATREGRRSLFCGLCRAKGIPARIAEDGEPEYWENGEFRRLGGEKRVSFRVVQPEGSAKLSLSRFDGEMGWQAIPLAEDGLIPGEYRLVTAVRLPNGDQLGWFKDLRVCGGEELRPAAREACGQGLMQNMSLPQLGFEPEGPGLLCWIEPGEEPTEHLLLELREGEAELNELRCRVHLMCEDPEKLSYLPPQAVLHPFDTEIEEAVARRVYLEPGRLPLLVLVDESGIGKYACAGYNVGSIELAAGLIRSLI